jgi:superfamily II DNA or RNA helicase
VNAYHELLARKSVSVGTHGLARVPKLAPVLFDFQRDVVAWALKQGRAALFLDTGLGKTVCQLEWARHVPGDVLIVAPLAVAQQTVREAADKLGMTVAYSRDGSVCGKVTITNYERVELFDLSRFAGVVLDESSILKSFMGKTKSFLIQSFAKTPFRLACTATPAPNDFMELGNHAEFLGVMPSNEMLTRWFINDTMNFGTYRLKGHAVKPFWQWVASWAACLSSPADIGYNGDAYKLPPVSLRHHVIDAPIEAAFSDGWLFDASATNATSLHRNKRKTIRERASLVAELVAAEPDEAWVVWCESNDESAALKAAIPHFVEVKGSDSPEVKEERLESFSTGKVRGIITKASIAGFGLNWQHSRRMVFASLSFSFEAFYQAVRRIWRFGQSRDVTVHVIISSDEHSVWATVADKMDRHEEMKSAMRFATFRRGTTSKVKVDYNPQHVGTLPVWLETQKAA